LIENVAKSVRRKQAVDDAYISDLYGDVRSLYRLDQIRMGSTSVHAGSEQGPLPDTAVALLVTLGTVWILIGAYAIIIAVKKRKIKHRY